MALVLFVETEGGTVVVDAVVEEPVSARAHLPPGVLGSIVWRRLRDWAEAQASVTWEVSGSHAQQLRLRDGTTTVTLDLVA